MRFSGREAPGEVFRLYVESWPRAGSRQSKELKVLVGRGMEVGLPEDAGANTSRDFALGDGVGLHQLEGANALIRFTHVSPRLF